ncbi:MAG: phosphoenolpyruvate synthase [Patescibacteria group bacterium]|mgnify:CR=1 FL=1
MTYTKWFGEISMSDVSSVGGKNASLGEMYSNLASRGVPVPNGFAITCKAYEHFFAHNDLVKIISSLLDRIDSKKKNMHFIGHEVRNRILAGEIPPDLAGEIISMYEELSGGSPKYVAVRSSATVEDSPTHSFAGQFETFLMVYGNGDLLHYVKQCFASLFMDRAISYRMDTGHDPFSIGMSVGVQKMVRSDEGSSGVIFTLDTESGFPDVIFLTSSHGLGELVVQGRVNPDEFYVSKPTLRTGHKPIIRRMLGSKKEKMIYTHGRSELVRSVETTESERKSFSLTDEEVLELARFALIIEDHYSNRAGHKVYMDIEWARDGIDGGLYIVQARPETVETLRNAHIYETYHLENRGKILAVGKSVGRKIAIGPAHIIPAVEHMHELKAGEVLVTDETNPGWEPIMKIASAIVTNRGGRTCHAAIIARELGIPAVVGTGNATALITNGQLVTVSCAEGDTGYIYDDALPFTIQKIETGQFSHTRTHLMLTLARPDLAFEASRMPCDGVGLARMEFIINNSVRIHPKALLEYAKLDETLRGDIDAITAGYGSPRDFFKKRLAEGIGMIAAAFWPRQVIVRTSDFKSNEYAKLIGGKQFEPEEENPMLGNRGAYRYYHPAFRDSFVLECEVLKVVREEMGFTNVELLIPMVRTVKEGKQVLELLADCGLHRGENDLKIYLMCELPVNALLAYEFLDDFDGFSIGSNDLTQTTLGMDRDSGMTIDDGDERNEAVKMLMRLAIHACRHQKKYSGICGQAPSDFPELTRWLVEQGIESISFNADALLEMIPVVVEAEKESSVK